ncbi:sigma-70 region 4 domain-containing protein [Actinoplanes sp. NPDC049548]|uniref:sigma-70 region 4 domain-containing protein n=1 Tax=Actinoplanes sp. NPDC049548 TaxID=3155152 RepID=UPI003429986C
MLTRHADPATVGRTQQSPPELLLRSLPAEQREVLVATYFCGRTTRDAARVLGLTPAAVNALLYQAMHEMSRMVAADGPRRAFRARVG